MKTVPRISDTEWEIMRILWSKHPLTASDVVAELTAASPDWHPKTARTLLARLVQKKALGYQAQGRSYMYSPLVSEEECVAAVSNSFLERVFGGSLEPMLAHFVRQQSLTRRELEDLRRLLDEQAEAKQTNRGGNHANNERR